jgi:murein DD-endopeptidase MepM/ murein hydrolase activator NlpD
MAGKIGGVIAIAALIGALFALAPPGEAAEGECGPVTLDQLFPDLDVHGNPLPTTTTAPATTVAEVTTTTGGSDDSSSTTSSEATTTTTSEATTTTTSEATTTSTNPVPLPPPPDLCTSWVYEMMWPLGVDSRVFSSFGVDRDGGSRRHKGNDLLAPTMAPVVAVADGIVSSIHSTPPDDCCWILVTHDDGWQSLYVHLNNDTYRTDDGIGHGVKPGLEVGDAVTAGQVVGWVGDSGNAEGSIPHLHFELRHPAGYPVDPYASLEAARAAADLPEPKGPYLDIGDPSVGFEASWLVTKGVFWPCDDRGLEFCPTRLAQPEDTLDLIFQMTGLLPPPIAASQRPVRLQDAIPRNRIGDALGCEGLEGCLQPGITSADLVRLAHWANLVTRSRLSPPGERAPDEVLILADTRQAERGLRALGIIGICHESVDAEQLLNHAEVARLLSWWLLGEGADCDQSAAATS